MSRALYLRTAAGTWVRRGGWSGDGVTGPGPLRNVVGTAVSPTTARIADELPADDGGSPLTGIRRTRNDPTGTLGGPYSVVDPPTQRSRDFINLAPSTQPYVLTATPVTAFGDGPTSSVQVTLPAAPPVTPGSPVVNSSHQSGVYCGWNAPAATDAFGAARGRPVQIFSDVFDLSNYAYIQNPSAQVNGWGPNRDMVYGLAPVVTGGGSLSAVASGAQDAVWRGCAQTLVNGGQGDAWIRIGYELQNNQFLWNALGGKHVDFQNAYRRIVDVYRSVPGQAFKFTWNVMTRSPSGFDALLAWPNRTATDHYVDAIGLDIYDESWGAYTTSTAQPSLAQRQAAWTEQYSGDSRGILFWLNYGASKGIPICIPEWGLVMPGAHHGGGDDAYFIDKMFELCNREDVIWDSYYNVAVGGLGDSRLASFPTARTRYNATFGAQGVT